MNSISVLFLVFLVFSTASNFSSEPASSDHLWPRNIQEMGPKIDYPHGVLTFNDELLVFNLVNPDSNSMVPQIGSWDGTDWSFHPSILRPGIQKAKVTWKNQLILTGNKPFTPNPVRTRGNHFLTLFNDQS